jgi:hypothetical protein
VDKIFLIILLSFLATAISIAVVVKKGVDSKEQLVQQCIHDGRAEYYCRSLRFQ